MHNSQPYLYTGIDKRAVLIYTRETKRQFSQLMYGVDVAKRSKQNGCLFKKDCIVILRYLDSSRAQIAAAA
jgi:hypothetical protein